MFWKICYRILSFRITTKYLLDLKLILMLLICQMKNILSTYWMGVFGVVLLKNMLLLIHFSCPYACTQILRRWRQTEVLALHRLFYGPLWLGASSGLIARFTIHGSCFLPAHLSQVQCPESITQTQKFGEVWDLKTRCVFTRYRWRIFAMSMIIYGKIQLEWQLVVL